MEPNLQPKAQRAAISPFRVVMVGQLVVNLPVIAIVALVFLAGSILFPGQVWIEVVAAIVLGWVWWMLAVRRWRAWALSRGISPRELARLAAFSGLARPGDWYIPEEPGDDGEEERG
jgi:hypothetical protein